MNINEQKLWENYKRIEAFCIINGELIPQLLERWLPVEYGGMPDEYRLTDNEKEILFQKRTGEIEESLEKEWQKRRQTENEITQNRHDKYNSIGEYVEAELNSFLKKYPQFKEIIE